MYVTVSQAATALQHARALELMIPPHVVDAEEARAEVDRIAHTRPPARPSLPTDPDDIADAVHGHAAALATHRQVAAITHEFTPDAATWFVRAVQASTASWCDAATEIYRVQINRFVAARRNLPQQEGDLEENRLKNLTPKQFKAWQAADKAAHTLDAVVTARRDWERLGDYPAAGRWGRLGLAAHMRPIPTTDDAPDYSPRAVWQWIVWGRKTWEDVSAGRVRRWAALVEATEHAPLVLALPPAGQVHAHAETFAAWLDVVLTPVSKAVSSAW